MKNETRYYDELEKMVKNGSLDDEEKKKLNEILNEELARKNVWLANSFDSTADFIDENYEEIVNGEYDYSIDDYVKQANAEIEIFYNNGFWREARRMKTLLECTLANC